MAYFGLISRTKGLETLIDALGRLPSTVRLLLIGGAATTAEDRAYAAAIERQIAERGLGTRVQRTGHCAPAEVSAYLLAADIAALPFSDGASFRRGSLLAALAHGLPVITTAPAGARCQRAGPARRRREYVAGAGRRCTKPGPGDRPAPA
ncbi:MAG: glycosyltransferase [Kouleothrix sp.]|nr:glycosyltransferase [Kouleothrix sp.]